MPNVNFCKEKSLTRARCTETLTGNGREINDTVKLHGKTWWESRVTNVQMPMEDVAELKKFVLKMCEKYPKVCKENNTEAVMASLDKQMVEQEKEPEVTPEEKPVVVAPIDVVPKSRIPLYWENTTEPHPERKAWSDIIVKKAYENLASFDSASDITLFCPKWKSLTNEVKVKAVGELFAGMASFESGYNPKTIFRECNVNKCVYKSGCFKHPQYGYCMQGNKKYEDGVVTSRGLLQLSIGSSKDGYKCAIEKAEDLHDPIKNLECGAIIMKQQIKREGKISAAVSYWSVIKPTNKKQPQIVERVKKYTPLCK